MSNKNKKYFITGGGTGGHIYPAMAVADALAKQDDVEIFYVGNPNNLEYSIVKEKGYKFLSVDVEGLPRKLGLKLLICAIKLGFGVLKSMYYLKKYSPDKIFGTGGYVSAPIMMAAAILKEPCFMMHDCDARAGLVTRKLSPYAEAISLTFEKAKESIENSNIYMNGNPLRPQFKQMTKGDARQQLNLDSSRPTLLVMGGSQGAKTICAEFVEIIKELSKDNNIQIIMQTGKNNYNDVINRLKNIYPKFEKDKNLMIKPYFDDMIPVLKSADIVISRAGSLSLSEIFASEVAPVLIPYPYAAADHQRVNAKYVLENEACIYLEEKDADSNKLKEIINNLIENKELQAKLKQNSSKLAKFDALENIVNQFVQLGEQ